MIQVIVGGGGGGFSAGAAPAASGGAAAPAAEEKKEEKVEEKEESDDDMGFSLFDQTLSRHYLYALQERQAVPLVNMITRVIRWPSQSQNGIQNTSLPVSTCR